MKTLKISIFLIIGVLMMSNTSELYAQMQVLVDTKKTFEAINRLEISSSALEVEYIGDPNMKVVVVEAYLESTQDGQDIVFVTLGEVLKISYQQNDLKNISWGLNQTKGYIRIKGPESIQLSMTGGSGKIRIDGVSSEFTSLKVGSGHLQIANIRGDLETSAGSGRIEISDVSGYLKLKMGSGTASLSNLYGDADVSFSSGSFKASNVEGLLSLSVSSGNAKLSNVAQLGNVSISSGSVKAEKSGLSSMTNLKASSGSIKINTDSNLNDYNYNLKATSGSLRVGDKRQGKTLQINNGSPNMVNGSVSSGSISIEN
ncbi:DUF4097 domain-containing protein [Belliella sp. R4-6]|uniref:DUF4097 domain-containing protein n=1 Tax=Belliella alkalica TaxID=1730871 RepID=A0ABS9VDE0_9BACT|nr:DUF4097 family beta strand repeat-containing protein [Belliella alkalica]MCH7414446.1 DUF4097 domain-containing protein [Belliella alkalica]